MMAKRKRLSPAPAFEIPDPMVTTELAGDMGRGEDVLDTKAVNGWVGVRSRAPIADVAGETAHRSALDEVAAEMHSARTEGRMVVRLPLDAIDVGHLVRDRMVADGDDMETLIDSLRDRGQQTPIEVVSLAPGRYGLISGWRRLTALQTLSATEPEADKFATIQALIRTPDGAADAYRAMVEENEIRADLSFYERARIAVQASAEGVFENPKQAVQSLFSAARRAKRSKILSFTDLVAALDDVLTFPMAIPEKLGLALVAALRGDPAFAVQLREDLQQAGPFVDPTSERFVLEQSLKSPQARKPEPAERGERGAPHEQLLDGVMLRIQAGKVTLSGPRVDDQLVADLREWLTQRGT